MPRGAWALAGALQSPGQQLQGTFGVPLPFTDWRIYFWPVGAGIQKGQLALGFSDSQGSWCWEVQGLYRNPHVPAVPTPEKEVRLPVSPGNRRPPVIPMGPALSEVPSWCEDPD